MRGFMGIPVHGCRTGPTCVPMLGYPRTETPNGARMTRAMCAPPGLRLGGRQTHGVRVPDTEPMYTDDTRATAESAPGEPDSPTPHATQQMWLTRGLRRGVHRPEEADGLAQHRRRDGGRSVVGARRDGHAPRLAVVFAPAVSGVLS